MIGKGIASCVCMVLLLQIVGCKTSEIQIENQAVPINEGGSIEELKTFMTGRFSSTTQSIMDSAYYNIFLEMTEIWLEKDGHWLYIEQARAGSMDEPYRQRVYKLEKEGDQYMSKVYVLEKPERFVGAWDKPDLFDEYDTDILTERTGCTVYLVKAGDIYTGSTRANRCESTLNGASYATSSVIIEEEQLELWDRGYDSDGKQVWGAEKGAYFFQRI